MRDVLADMSVMEELRRSGKQRITLGHPSDGWVWVNGMRESVFEKGQHLVATDAQDGTEKHWRVVDHYMDDGVLVVEPWS